MIDKKYEKWTICSKKDLDNIIKLLQVSVEKNNINELENIFRNKPALRSLILMRGENDIYLDLLDRAFFILLNNKNLALKKESLDDILFWFKDRNISEDVIGFMADVFFHKRDKEKLDNIFRLVAGNRDKFKNDYIYYWILHTKATWLSVVENDFEGSIKYNSEVITGTKDSEKILYFKAKFGISASKILMPKQKIRDMKEIADNLFELGNIHDAFRARIKIAKFILDLSLQQGVKDIAFENLEEAKRMALATLKFSKDVAYTNLEIISSEVLAKIYFQRAKKIGVIKDRLKNNENNKILLDIYKKYYPISKDDKRKSKSYQKNAEALRAKYNYKTSFFERYKI